MNDKVIISHMTPEPVPLLRPPRLLLFCLGLLSSFSSLADDAKDKIRYLEESRPVASGFIQQLGGEVKREFLAKGPEAALKVCTERAPELAKSLSDKHGWRISRVSLKPRNLILGTPDAWEQRVITTFEQRAFQGENPQNIEYGDIVSELGGRSYRYMKALTMQEVCIACHGTSEKINPGVKKRVDIDYPHDKAIGYQPGQIRGAITIKRPLSSE